MKKLSIGIGKMLNSKYASAILGVVIIGGTVLAAAGFAGGEQPRTKEQIYAEQVEMTNQVSKAFAQQIIQEFKARKDVAIEKGQAAFAEENNAEVDRLQELIIKIDQSILFNASINHADEVRAKLEAGLN